MALFSRSINFVVLFLFYFNINAGVNGYGRDQVVLFENEQPYCAGTIVGDNYIVTAAHCVIDNKTNDFREKPILIGIGTDNQTKGDFEYPVFRYVEEVMIPKVYPDEGSDIAILKLPSNFGALAQAKILEMARSSDTDSNIIGNVSSLTLDDPAYIYTDSDGNMVSRYPTGFSYQDVWVLSHTKCSKKWNKDYNEYHLCNNVEEPFDAEEKPCYRDGGSGLFYKDRLIGVVSQSRKCDEDPERRPTIYTRVSLYSKWIDAAVKEQKNSWNSKFYDLVDRFAHT